MIGLRTAALLAAALCAGAPAAAQPLPPMPGSRPLVLGAATPADEPVLAALLARADAALAAGDGAQAELAYEQAVALRHAVEIEIGWLRAQLQSGDYRRALAFAAHVAGAHRDAAAGAALYAWLLERGAQGAAARSQLDAARRRWPDDPALQWVAQRLAAATPPAAAAPLRLGPHASGEAVPAGARLVATALRLDAGRALAPQAALVGVGQVWLRDGLGRTRRAVVAQRDAASGVVLLRVAESFGAAPEWQAAARDAFPGSPAFALGYEGDSAAPAWPAMAAGLLGRTRLGVNLAASGGGPVFDHAARLVGLSLPGADGAAATLLPLSAFRTWLPQAATPARETGSARVAPDAIYETALAATLQLIVAP